MARQGWEEMLIKIIPITILTMIFLTGCRARLHHAIYEDDVTEAKRLIKDGRMDIEKVFSHRTPLILAVERGHLELVKSLVQAGADINHANVDQMTPLMAACQKGHKEIVQYLIKMGAEIYVHNNHGETPLVIACSYERKDLLPLLINIGSDLEAKDVRGWTPLIFAITWNDIPFIKLLLKKGANVNHRIRNSYRQYSEYYNEDTPLHVAAYQGNTEVVQLLLKNGAMVNTLNRFGYSPLYFAVDNDRLDLIELLLQAGASPFQLEGTADDIYNTAKLFKILAMRYENKGDVGKALECYRVAVNNFQRATPLLFKQSKVIASQRARASKDNVIKVVGTVVQFLAAFFGEREVYLQTDLDGTSRSDLQEMKDLQAMYKQKSQESHKSALECQNIILYLEKKK